MNDGFMCTRKASCIQNRHGCAITFQNKLVVVKCF